MSNEHFDVLKYLLFVHTCSEKRVIAERVSLEFSSIHPRPPALRVFDAGAATVPCWRG